MSDHRSNAGPAAVGVAPRTYAVDLWERGRRDLTSGYLIAAPHPAIVDTGSARSVPVWLDALAAMGVAAGDVAYIIVTHIHLDHAGGAGILLRHCPRAQVVVHRHGARHLIDPSRLVASARRVFGENLDAYYGIPHPVPASRLLVAEEGGTLNLGGGHGLVFYDAFGHARHQHAILDTGTRCLFGGDEFGKRIPQISDDYVLPDTPPTQFDPIAMARSAALLLTLRPDAVLLSHVGRCPLSVESHSGRLREQVEAYAALGRAGERALPWEMVQARLTEHIKRDLAARAIAWTPTVERELADEIAIWSQGIADYYERRSPPG
jgi:glyoxylase-like metal-dependent hydrolase (beta-lactamase superfamily II)